MKPVLLAAAVFCLVSSTARAGDSTVEAPIRRVMDGFNHGDIAAVKAAHIAAPTIVDNVAPFFWSGPGAFDRWLADLGKAEAAQGKTGGTVTFAPVVDEIVQGDHAYVVTRSSYTFKQKGRTMREAGYTSFVLVKAGTEWRISSWSWASPTAASVK